jgi:DNA-binding XRE family transcriptional regulator
MELTAETIWALRTERGLTQEGLAHAAGVAKATVQNAEAGKPLSNLTKRALAQALGVQIAAPGAGAADAGEAVA